MDKIFDCVIIGAGPTGIGAALYLHDKGFDIALIEKGMPGGKINIAPRVDNYPGQKEIPRKKQAISLSLQRRFSYLCREKQLPKRGADLQTGKWKGYVVPRQKHGRFPRNRQTGNGG